MSLPAFASLDDFGVRLPGGLADADVPRAQAALDDASTEIRSEAGQAWESAPEDPSWAADALMRICCAVARRSFTNPDGVTQSSLGSYSESVSNASPDVYLTAAEKRTIARIAGRTTGLWTLSTTREDACVTDLPAFCGDAYIEVEGSELLPFLPIDAGNGL